METGKEFVTEFVLMRHVFSVWHFLKASSCCAAVWGCHLWCRQALNWLLRSVTQPTCLHDLLWHFIQALSPDLAAGAASAGDSQPGSAADEVLVTPGHCAGH